MVSFPAKESTGQSDADSLVVSTAPAAKVVAVDHGAEELTIFHMATRKTDPE